MCAVRKVPHSAVQDGLFPTPVKCASDRYVTRADVEADCARLQTRACAKTANLNRLATWKAPSKNAQSDVCTVENASTTSVNAHTATLDLTAGNLSVDLDVLTEEDA